MSNLTFLKKNQTHVDVHVQELLHGTSIALSLKILAAGLSFSLNMILARLLGAEGAGVFFLTFTVVLIVAAIGRIGMENSLVRFVAANVAGDKFGKVLGVYHKAMFYSMVVTVILSALLYLLAPWLSQVIFKKIELAYPLTIMAIAVVPLSLLTLHGYALQGLKKIAASTVILSVLVPLLTCLVSILFVPSYGINAAVWGYLFATLLTLLLAYWCWKSAIYSFRNYIVEFDRKELLSSSMPLFSVVLMNMVITWSPLLFLGVWESSKNIGIYSIANRTAMLTSFILVAVNSIAAPKFAAFYQQRDFEALEKVSRHSTKLMIILALPVLFLFLVMPSWILGLFGEQFQQGKIVLMILAIGQFVNVATGSVGYLLMMTGKEQLLRNNLLFCAILSILLNLCLIPNYGILGASICAAFILSIQNVIAMILVWEKLRIRTFPWP